VTETFTMPCWKPATQSLRRSAASPWATASYKLSAVTSTVWAMPSTHASRASRTVSPGFSLTLEFLKSESHPSTDSRSSADKRMIIVYIYYTYARHIKFKLIPQQ
jgi:hypothetical protein